MLRLLEGLEDAIIAINESGIIVTANEGACRLFEYDSIELVGASVNKLMPTSTAAHHDEYLKRYLNSDRKITRIIGKVRKLRGTKKSGTTFPMELSLSEVQEEDKKYFVSIIRDKSIEEELLENLKQAKIDAEKEAAFSQAILATAVDPIIIINDKGIIQQSNLAATKLFGYTKEEFKNANISILMTDEIACMHDNYLKRYCSKQSPTNVSIAIGKTRQLIAKRKDGNEFPIELSVSELCYTTSSTDKNNERFFTGIIRDITAITKKTKELQEANDRLSQLDKLKNDFLGNTSHELRTPLHAIIGISETLIQEKAKKKVSLHDEIEDLMLISSSAWSLLSQVNDLLDFSSYKNGKLNLRMGSVNLSALASIVVSMASKLVGDKDVVISCDIPSDLPPLYGDEQRIHQVLLNLVNNAVKFTKKGTIKIKIQQNAKENRATIMIEDTGVGIPKEKLSSIFNEFEQAHDHESREQGGVGLGLAICKRIISLHGSEINVTSEVGKGTTFSFDLNYATANKDDLLEQSSPNTTRLAKQLLSPNFEDEVHVKANNVHSACTNATETAEASIEASSTAINVAQRLLRQRTRRASVGIRVSDNQISSVQVSDASVKTTDSRVLIVDDNQANLHVLRRCLALNGMAVTQASNGAEAIDVINSTAASCDGIPFDIILLDIMMPGINGYDTCIHIRKQYAANRLPIILLTAKTQVADVVKGFKCGANDYLNKPFNIFELISRVRAHIQLAKIHNAYERFVPKQFLSLLNTSDITELNVGDQCQVEMTVLFCDIRSFTTISENLSPATLFNFLNEIFQRLNPIISEHGGFIDKYIGDAIMALFSSKSPYDALQTGIDIARCVKSILIPCTEDDGDDDNKENEIAQQLQMGVGIHCGTSIIGTLGDSKRMDTTVISDAVNVASRLEALTKGFNVSLLTSGDTINRLTEKEIKLINIRKVGFVEVKGRIKPIELYECFDADEYDIIQLKIKSLELFNNSIDFFFKEKIKRALACFVNVLEINSNDTVAIYYVKLCKQLLAAKAKAKAKANLTTTTTTTTTTSSSNTTASTTVKRTSSLSSAGALQFSKDGNLLPF